MLNAGAGLRGTRESLASFQERMAMRGLEVAPDGISVLPRKASEEAVVAAVASRAEGPREGSPEWERQEQERFAAFVNGGADLQAELGRKGRPKLAAPESAAVEPVQHDPDDPGGFWAYTLGGNYGAC